MNNFTSTMFTVILLCSNSPTLIGLYIIIIIIIIIIIDLYSARTRQTYSKALYIKLE